MELLYYFAIGHNNLSPRGFNFSNQMKINYSPDSGDISMELNPNSTTDFYGKNISSLSAMVGANGTGKTTILNTISRTIAYGNTIGPSGEFSFLVVYAKNGSMFYYPFNKINHNNKNKKIKLVSEEQWRLDLHELISIFFSQHIEPLYSENIFHRQDENRFPGRKDISTAFIYRQTILKNNNSIQNITRQFRKDDYRKYLKLFKNVTLDFDIKIPEFVTVRVFDIPQARFDKIYDNWSVDEFLNEFSHNKTIVDHVLNSILKNTIWQLLNKYTLNVKKNTELELFFDNLNKIKTKKNKSKNYSFSKLLGDLAEIFPVKHKSIINSAIKLCNYMEFSEFPEENINADGVWIKIDQNLKSLLSKLDKAGLFEDNLDFIEIGFSHHPHQYATYSSGEYLVWSLFSRIYDLKESLPKNTLLLLDEVELNLHPRWQRKLVNALVGFLNDNFGRKKFQIVLSSHSPLILSDIPKWGTILLSDGTIEENNFQETFGANIHDLYANNFILENELIGQFAQNKIQSIIDELNSKESSNNHRELKKIIDIIGEPFLKEQLTDMYYEKYESQYNKQKRRRQLEEELKNLEND